MKLPINLDPVRDFFSGDPLEVATNRLVSRLTIDRAVLRTLRRAASRGEARAALIYAWAAGARSGSDGGGNPVATADLALAAAQLAPDDPAAQACLGLAHAGAFGGRRTTPLTARRAFGQAARLAPGNLAAQLLLVAARYGSNDLPGAERALGEALEADTYLPFRSPLADRLAESAPWISTAWQWLWPERQSAARRFAITSLLAQRHVDAVLRLARGLAVLGPRELAVPLEALGYATQALDRLAWHDQAAGQTRAQAATLAARLVEEQRGLAARYERGAEGQIMAAGALGTLGLSAGLAGLIKSRRRWPPPIIAALPGRTIAGLGAAGVAAALGSVLVDNSAAHTRRQLLGRALVAQEAKLAQEAATAVGALLAPWVS